MSDVVVEVAIGAVGVSMIDKHDWDLDWIETDEGMVYPNFQTWDAYASMVWANDRVVGLIDEKMQKYR